MIVDGRLNHRYITTWLRGISVMSPLSREWSNILVQMLKFRRLSLVVPDIHSTSGLLSCHFEFPSSVDGGHCRQYHPASARDRKCKRGRGIQFSNANFRQSTSFYYFSAILAAILDSGSVTWPRQNSHFIDKSMLHQMLFTARRYLSPFASYMTLYALGGNFTPPPLPGRVAKKPLPVWVLIAAPNWHMAPLDQCSNADIIG